MSVTWCICQQVTVWVWHRPLRSQHLICQFLNEDFWNPYIPYILSDQPSVWVRHTRSMTEWDHSETKAVGKNVLENNLFQIVSWISSSENSRNWFLKFFNNNKNILRWICGICVPEFTKHLLENNLFQKLVKIVDLYSWVTHYYLHIFFSFEIIIATNLLLIETMTLLLLIPGHFEDNSLSFISEAVRNMIIASNVAVLIDSKTLSDMFRMKFRSSQHINESVSHQIEFISCTCHSWRKGFFCQ